MKASPNDLVHDVLFLPTFNIQLDNCWKDNKFKILVYARGKMDGHRGLYILPPGWLYMT